MGACASFPKGMRADTTAAPEHEPAKEDSVKPNNAVETTEEEVRVEEQQKKDADADVVVDDDDTTKHQSLGSLLDEVDEKKKETDENMIHKQVRENEAAVTEPVDDSQLKKQDIKEQKR